jgi:ABC-type Fe3+-citrate transport system substrate-binding protein
MNRKVAIEELVKQNPKKVIYHKVKDRLPPNIRFLGGKENIMCGFIEHEVWKNIEAAKEKIRGRPS